MLGDIQVTVRVSTWRLQLAVRFTRAMLWIVATVRPAWAARTGVWMLERFRRATWWLVRVGPVKAA